MKAEIEITAYQPYHRAGVLNFIEGHPQVHHHLDWEPISQWLRDPQNIIALAWQTDELCGMMAFSPPHAATTWLRLLVLPFEQRAEVFKALWQVLQPSLAQQVRLLAAMPTRPWVIPLLELADFEIQERVINLQRVAQPLPPAPSTTVKIRRARWWEFPKVLTVDHLAFGALWQLRPPDLREATRRAHYYTVALEEATIVGYQLSMRYVDSIHLSRLATLPTHQNRGIGSGLVYDLLTQAEKGHVELVTVNTQASNYSSRRVYERFGFDYDGDELPVYMFKFA